MLNWGIITVKQIFHQGEFTSVGYILEGVNLVPRLSCLGTVWYILYGCSVPTGNLVKFFVKHINANLKSEISIVWIVF